MINSLIATLLVQHNRVVVPALGAFIKKSDTGEVVFVELLKRDDGVLMSALEKEFSLGRNEAAEVIDNYIITLRRHILANGSFIIDRLGVMRQNANLAFVFEYNPAVSETDSAVAEPVAKKVAPVVAPVAKPVEMPVAEPKPEQTPQSIPEKPIDVTGLRYKKAASHQVVTGNSKRRTDMIMIVAIVAAVIAIIAMLYGLLGSTAPELVLDPIGTSQIEQIDSHNQ